jgi:hypothetical protein
MALGARGVERKLAMVKPPAGGSSWAWTAPTSLVRSLTAVRLVDASGNPAYEAHFPTRG